METNKIISALNEHCLDCILITDTKSIEYVIKNKFHCGERFIGLIIDKNGFMKLILNKIFDVDDIEIEKVIYYDHQDVGDIIINNLHGRKIGVDKNMAARFLLPIIRKSNYDFELNYIIDYCRAIKSHDEIAKMRTASLMNDQLMSEVKAIIKTGISELEIHDFIIEKARAMKNRDISFDPIVAFGDHAADAHALSSDRVLKNNETILIDMGLKYGGYCSDMTRVFFNGNSAYEDIYNIVLDANLAAIEMIRPGVTFAEIDDAARQVIDDAGYAEYFTHRLGHGIGKSVHEPFDVSGANDLIVESGMTFSIEPGIYIKDRIGIRIEDIVLVTDNGVEVLNNYSKKISKI